jgi:hypothetical protein
LAESSFSASTLSDLSTLANDAAGFEDLAPFLLVGGSKAAEFEASA